MRRLLASLTLISLLLGCGGTPADAQDRTLQMFQALWSKDLPVLQRMLESGKYDPDAPLSGYGWKVVDGKKVPINLYLLTGLLSHPDYTLQDKKQVLAMLKKAGADFNLRNDNGATALYWLLVEAKSGNLELVRILLEFGADPNAAPLTTWITIVDGKENQQLLEEPALCTLLMNKGYSAQEKVDTIGLFQRHRANFNVLRPGSSPVPLLHWVLDQPRDFAGKEAIVRALLEGGADPNALDANRCTVLQSLLASTDFEQYLELVRLALRRGADPGILNDWGQNALQTACSASGALQKRGIPLTQVLEALVEGGANLDQLDAKDRTLLFTAASQRLDELAVFLAAKGASIGVRDRQGNTALHALFDSFAPVSDRLLGVLSGPGADLNARGTGGATVLSLAAQKDEYLNVVKLLVEKGADLNLANDDECGPLGIALQKGAKQNAAFLKSKGAAPYSSRYPVGNLAPACQAVLGKDAAALAAVPLVELGQMTARTSWGVPATALHLAVEGGELPVVQALCRRKVDWNVEDRYGRTPLQLAVEQGRADLVLALVAAGADPTHNDSRGASPLSRASGLRPEIARTLLARGCAPKDAGPAVCAIYTGNLELVQALYEGTSWLPVALDMSAGLGQQEILEFLGTRIPHGETPLEKLREQARESREALRNFAIAAEKAQQEPARAGSAAAGASGAAGAAAVPGKAVTYTHIVQSWCPWKKPDTKKRPQDYPVAIWVPKDYDGTKPYGLLVSMIHAQSANQLPRPEFAKALERHHLLWAGFDPYNGIFDGFEDTHEAFALAVVWDLLGRYALDRSRVYLAGFSWGGRLTGEIVPKQPQVFRGGIAIGGCFTKSQRVTPALEWGRERITMVLVTGDYDYNRLETYNGYSALASLGYRSCYFLQEPLRGHTVLSAENFEKALRLLDQGGR